MYYKRKERRKISVQLPSKHLWNHNSDSDLLKDSRSFNSFSIGFRSGDWLGHSRGFIFFSLKPSESFLGSVLGIVVFLKRSRSFHGPGRWQHIFSKNVLVHFSIYTRFVCQCHILKNSPTLWCSKLHCCWCFGGDMQCLWTPKHGVCFGIHSSAALYTHGQY